MAPAPQSTKPQQTFSICRWTKRGLIKPPKRIVHSGVYSYYGPKTPRWPPPTLIHAGEYADLAGSMVIDPDKEGKRR